MNRLLLPTLLAAAFAFIGLSSTAAAQGQLYDRVLARADLNRDNKLTMVEFMGTQSGSTRWTDAAHRFQYNDVNDDGYLDLLEFRASRGGRDGGRPTKRETFLLADQNDDGYLDPTEYGLTQPQTWKARQILRNFDLRDVNDDSKLTGREFGGPTLANLTPPQQS